jgi:hypothetical protein
LDVDRFLVCCEGVLGSLFCVGKNLQFCFISHPCVSLRGRVSVNTF